MKISWQVLRTLVALLLSAHIALAATADKDKDKEKPKSIYDYSLVSLDGKVVPLSTYKGKVLLIVNLASKSIYNDQIAALNDLEKTYSDKGLVVLGIPSSDFGAEELTDNAALDKYYHQTAKATFTVFAKTSLRGNEAIPLVKFLTDPKEGGSGGEIHWNFTKFLVDKEGKPLMRYESDADPADPDFRVTIEKVLDGTFKKKGGGDKGGPPAGGDDDDDDDGGI